MVLATYVACSHLDVKATLAVSFAPKLKTNAVEEIPLP